MSVFKQFSPSVTHGKVDFGKKELQKNTEITIIGQDEICPVLYPD